MMGYFNLMQLQNAQTWIENDDSQSSSALQKVGPVFELHWLENYFNDQL
jgi:hypothetical protein